MILGISSEFEINNKADEIKRMFDAKDYGISDEKSINHALKNAHALVKILKEMKKSY